MRTLLFHEPGHFHAALLLRARNPRIDRSVHVYSTAGPDLEHFCGLIAGFNGRSVDPTDWNLHIHRAGDPLGQLIAERRGDVAVVAGRNEPKMTAIRSLHTAGLNVLADKPWITTSAALPDLDRVTCGPPLVMDIMTERYDAVARLRHRIVATKSVFGRFASNPEREPALDFSSVHHLCKNVDGRPLIRPQWYYDVREQGDGLVDIQSHLVDQAQWLVDAAETARPHAGTDSRVDTGGSPVVGTTGDEVVIDGAERWSTRVPLALFTESTGASSFPPSLSADVHDDVLDLACNGRIDYRLRGVTVRHRTIWRLRPPAGGGDTHRAMARGTGAHVVVQHGPETGGEPRIHVVPSDQRHVVERLTEGVDEWRSEFSGLEMAPSEHGHELIISAASRTPHEATFALVLDDFIDQVERGGWSAHSAETIRTRYTLLAGAHELASETG